MVAQGGTAAFTLEFGESVNENHAIPCIRHPVALHHRRPSPMKTLAAPPMYVNPITFHLVSGGTLSISKEGS